MTNKFQSQKTLKIVFKVLAIVSLVGLIVPQIIVLILDVIFYFNRGRISFYNQYPSVFDFIELDGLVMMICIGIVSFFVLRGIGTLVCKLLSNIELTITSKRVFGCNAFGKRVDLPTDSIAAIGLHKVFHAVIITTAAGAIRFSFLRKYRLFHYQICNLLINRQKESTKLF